MAAVHDNSGELPSNLHFLADKYPKQVEDKASGRRMSRHRARRRPAGGVQGGGTRGGGAQSGGRRRTGRRLEVGAHRGEAVEEGRRRRGEPHGKEPRAAALRPSWRKKGRGMTSGSYVSDQFFLEWSRGIDGETVGSLPPFD
ncbi:hypothetical protein PVAP13_7NG340700 [Panicum virgatum]|uniref:Uncharacterized protein n=1 Tax=Panicum virgatum TaxID=38727 RepID=A0A8T0Q4F0_PANVG|nr:hypothetical protein PVAP13_7NG340700 [Panicum virgatum]